jgi:hypothetical protein
LALFEVRACSGRAGEVAEAQRHGARLYLLEEQTRTANFAAVVRCIDRVQTCRRAYKRRGLGHFRLGQRSDDELSIDEFCDASAARTKPYVVIGGQGKA